MPFYMHIWPIHGKEHFGVWDVQPTFAKRVGVPRAEEHHSSFVRADGAGILTAFRARFPNHYFAEMELAPGQYYPRMARPVDQYPREGPGSNPEMAAVASEIANYRSQLHVLTRQLQDICQTVHPSATTLNTFGHNIRNLLILACTEVEAHWRGVLLANGYPDNKLTTNDYVKLADAMRLREFSVTFPAYPWLTAVRPFDGWGQTGRPTQELGWYVDYHAVKHDRERQFEQATLSTVFSAVTACAVMIWAQFGHDGLGVGSELRTFFNLKDVPQWEPNQAYTYPYEGYAAGWAPQQFRF